MRYLFNNYSQLLYIAYILLALVMITENYEDQKNTKKDQELKALAYSFGAEVTNHLNCGIVSNICYYIG